MTSLKNYLLTPIEYKLRSQIITCVLNHLNLNQCKLLKIIVIYISRPALNYTVESLYSSGFSKKIRLIKWNLPLSNLLLSKKQINDYSKALRCTFFGELKSLCSSKSCIIRLVVCNTVFKNKKSVLLKVSTL